MSKATGSKREKSRRSKRARDVAVRDAAPTAAAGRQPAPVVSPPAPGQRLYDMPYSSPAPRLVNPELGLEHLVARAGHNAGYEIDLTLLDAPDHRLMRSGVLLAHRVLEGRGEWYLGAPDWVPLLPKELIESMNQAELSEDMADLIRPFRRRAPLTPVAALRCERREFALRAAQGGATVALLRDDKVTVRRGGLTTARYREVMLTPVGPGLDQDQAEWLDQCLTGAGATVLRSFPRLARRLGAPATGPTDFPEPQPFDPQAPFSTFVSSLLALRLRQLLAADLRLRSGDQAAAADLVAAVGSLRWELDGLRTVLDEEWTADLLDELEWVAADLSDPDPTGDDLADRAQRLAARLRGERYLTLLDHLVVAARGGRVGDIGGSAHRSRTRRTPRPDVGPDQSDHRSPGRRRPGPGLGRGLGGAPTVPDRRPRRRAPRSRPDRGTPPPAGPLPAAARTGARVQRLGGGSARGRRRPDGGGSLCVGSGVRAQSGERRRRPGRLPGLLGQGAQKTGDVSRARGTFVVLEGGDGVGKSTQLSLLCDWLEARGERVVRTFEPGDTAVGQQIRRLVLDPATGELSARAEALLYAADKAQHVDTVIRPALQSGAVVVSDRYVDSMIAYQGAGRAMSPAEVEEVARWATEHLHPDLTVVLDSEPGRAVGVISDKDRLEARGRRLPPTGPAALPGPGRARPGPLSGPRRQPLPGRPRRRHSGPRRRAAVVPSRHTGPMTASLREPSKGSGPS